MLSFSLFYQYLFSKRSGALIRTISRLCIFGIGVGVMSLIVVLSVMNGFNESIRFKLLAVEPHLVVSIPDKNWDEYFKYFSQNKTAEVHKFEKQDVIIRTIDGTFNGAVAQGIEFLPLKNMIARINKISKGRAATSIFKIKNAADLGPGEAMIGADLARSLNILEGDLVTIIPPETLLLPVGEIPIYEKVRISSILSTDLPEIDGRIMFYGLDRSLKSLKGSASREVGLEVRLEDPDNLESMTGDLMAMGATVSSWKQRNSALFFALKMEKLAMTIFLSLSALITSFSIITVLVLLITQKRKDIGILMAMGLSQAKTRRVFTGVGLLLSSLGVAVGLILGVGVSYLLDKYPLEVLPDIYYDSSIPSSIDPMLVGFIAIISAVIAVFSAWVPVRLNVRLTPAEALQPNKH